MEPLQLSTAQSFEIERTKRLIDNTDDVTQLRKIAKQLLEAWMGQKAAFAWAMRQNLSGPPRVTPAALLDEHEKEGPEPPSAT